MRGDDLRSMVAVCGACVSCCVVQQICGAEVSGVHCR